MYLKTVIILHIYSLTTYQRDKEIMNCFEVKPCQAVEKPVDCWKNTAYDEQAGEIIIYSDRKAKSELFETRSLSVAVCSPSQIKTNVWKCPTFAPTTLNV